MVLPVAPGHKQVSAGSWATKCPLQWAEATRALLHFSDNMVCEARAPQKFKNRRPPPKELVVPVRMSLEGGGQGLSTEWEALIDSGAQLLGAVGRELVPPECAVSSPFPVTVTGADQSVIKGGGQGVWMNLSVPVWGKYGSKIFQFVHIFVYILDIGPKFILGYPFLEQFQLAIIPGIPLLVPVESIRLRPWGKYIAGPHQPCPKCHWCVEGQGCPAHCQECRFLTVCRIHTQVTGPTAQGLSPPRNTLGQDVCPILIHGKRHHCSIGVESCGSRVQGVRRRVRWGGTARYAYSLLPQFQDGSSSESDEDDEVPQRLKRPSQVFSVACPSPPPSPPSSPHCMVKDVHTSMNWTTAAACGLQRFDAAEERHVAGRCGVHDPYSFGQGVTFDMLLEAKTAMTVMVTPEPQQRIRIQCRPAQWADGVPDRQPALGGQQHQQQGWTAVPRALRTTASVRQPVVHASLEAPTFGHTNYWAPLQGKQDSGVAEGRVEATALPRKDPPPPTCSAENVSPTPTPLRVEVAQIQPSSAPACYCSDSAICHLCFGEDTPLPRTLNVLSTVVQPERAVPPVHPCSYPPSSGISSVKAKASPENTGPVPVGSGDLRIWKRDAIKEVYLLRIEERRAWDAMAASFQHILTPRDALRGVQIIIREEQQAIGGLLGSFQRILPSLPPPLSRC